MDQNVIIKTQNAKSEKCVTYSYRVADNWNFEINGRWLQS